MTIKTTIVAIALAACLAAGGLVLARESGDHPEVSTEKLIEQALAGEEGKEVVAQTYLFPRAWRCPGISIPMRTRSPMCSKAISPSSAPAGRRSK
jgi:hypothetical protein